jgi:basic membrane protein A
MKNKKMTILLILIVGLSLIISGCSNTSEAETGGKKIDKIAFFHGGSIADEGWDMLHHEAMLAIEEKYPDIETVFVENQPYSADGTRTLEQLANDGADIIFITTEYADIVYEAAEKYPDTVFIECNGHKAEGNVTWWYVEHWDPSYLIGMVAGLMTETNKLGFIGPFPYSTVYTSANAFHMGARSVNPDVETTVVLVNSWFDPAAERQAAEALADSGVDMLFGSMNGPAYLEAAEELGIMAAMWTVDMREFGPDAYISSVKVDWTPYHLKIVDQIINGTFNAADPLLMPIGQGVDRDEWGQNVPQDVRDQVEAVREKMLNGEFYPWVGPIYDASGQLRVKEGEKLSSLFLYQDWDWAVEGVVGFP